MQEFVMLAGLPGSGKSTLGGELQKAKSGLYVASTDGLRLALNGGVYPREADGRYRALNPIVWELAREAVRRLLDGGHSAALDATNLTKAHRAEWIDFARKLQPGIRVAIHWCEGKWDSAERWRILRGYMLPEYLAVRAKLEADAQPPDASEANEVTFHHRDMTGENEAIRELVFA